MLNEKALAALKNAIEGECDGLAIDDRQANSILQHVFAALPSSPVSELVADYLSLLEPYDEAGLRANIAAFLPRIQAAADRLTALEAENARLREGLGGRESAKLYHSLWPTEDLLKARGPGGLITDDGEAWKYQYTHSDAQGGTYDLVYRPTSEHSAITAPQGGDHGE